MAIKIETTDCTGLGDAELAEMADMCAEGAATYDVGLLSKHCEQWVLITQAREGGKLVGFSFCTLERIGGTPSVLIGLASVRRSSRRDAALRALVGDQLRRAVLAFPDEDVLVGTRFVDPSALVAFTNLDDIVPRPGHKATGEERAWARRLAKRFGADGRVNDRTFVVEGTGDQPPVLDYESADPDGNDADVVALFAEVDHERGDALIVFGWAMAEDLAALGR
jgi:nucleotide-binding universal stress UspA family protein